MQEVATTVFRLLVYPGNTNFKNSHSPPERAMGRGPGRNRIGRRKKWSKYSWEEGEIGGKSREEGEKEKLAFREEGEIGSKSREEGEIGSESRDKGDSPPPVPPPSMGYIGFNCIDAQYSVSVFQCRQTIFF